MRVSEIAMCAVVLVGLVAVCVVLYVIKRGAVWLQGICSDGTSLYYVGGAVGGSYGRTNVYRFGP